MECFDEATGGSSPHEHVLLVETEIPRPRTPVAPLFVASTESQTVGFLGLERAGCWKAAQGLTWGAGRREIGPASAVAAESPPAVTVSLAVVMEAYDIQRLDTKKQGAACSHQQTEEWRKNNRTETLHTGREHGNMA